MEYVCDFCESPVQLTDTVCKVCGAQFSDVRCPSCGHKGTSTDFKKGCPRCSHNFVLMSAKNLKINLNLTSVTVILLVITIPLMIMVLFRIL